MGIKQILVVDDNDTNIQIVIELLSAEYEVMAAIDGAFALDVAINDKPDLILLDIMMPIMDGYEVCEKLQENINTKDIPVIFMTAKTDEISIEKAYEVGGMDYVTKPVKPKELLARVKTQLKIRNLIQNLEQSKKALKFLAATDSLTGLYNRRYFSKISKKILNLAKRDESKVSVLMLDIDNFKSINDTYGHYIGDEVLIYLSKQLQNSTRVSDVICRYGGEEFVILLPQTDIDGTLSIAEKIRTEVEIHTICIDNCDDLKFTISIGVSEVNIIADSSIEESLNRADKALYIAKENGKNNVYSV